jgi:hypothetical protein
MNSAWASLKPYLPPSRTPRQRFAVAGGALLLLVGLGWSLWALLSPEKVDYGKTWFSVEFTTDNQAHPVHLTLPDGKEGLFDLLMIENFSDKPLSLLAFSSRPRIPGLPPNQTMTAWAQWIATSRQGIVVRPRSTWVLDPSDLSRLPAIHGHTWIGVNFDDSHPAEQGVLPATVLGPAFRGHYRVTYCPSQLSEGQVSLPQVNRHNLVGTLQSEIDSNNKTSTALSPLDLTSMKGFTGTDLR